MVLCLLKFQLFTGKQKRKRNHLLHGSTKRNICKRFRSDENSRKPTSKYFLGKQQNKFKNSTVMEIRKKIKLKIMQNKIETKNESN